MSNIKILIIGCGSIGRRHAKNARKLGAVVSLCDTNVGRMTDFALEVDAQKCFSDYKIAAKESDAQAVIIATPSNLHIEHASFFITHGKHILMEKPLCIDAQTAYGLKKCVEDANVVFMMAHVFRFRNDWRKVKTILDSCPIGKILSAEFYGGWYLPDWHINEKYQQEYAANKKSGGGVLLTNLSHIFDIVSWLFGDISKIAGAKMRQSDLEIDVDDSITCAIQTKSGIGVTIVEDFLSRCPRRMLRVNGYYGYIEVDFNRNKVVLWDARSKRVLPGSENIENKKDAYFKIIEDGVMYDMEQDVSSLEYCNDDPYLNEMKHFFEIVDQQLMQHDLDINSGIRVIETLAAQEIKDWT